MTNPIHPDLPELPPDWDSDRDGLAKLFGINDTPLEASELTDVVRAALVNAFGNMPGVLIHRQTPTTLVFQFGKQGFTIRTNDWSEIS